jgi:hypothetical protein
MIAVTHLGKTLWFDHYSAHGNGFFYLLFFLFEVIFIS